LSAIHYSEQNTFKKLNLSLSVDGKVGEAFVRLCVLQGPVSVLGTIIKIFWNQLLCLKLCFNAFRLYLWEILHLTIRKMNKHVSRLGRELTEARERLRHAESDSDESEDGDGEGNNNSAQRGMSDDHEKPSEDMVDRMEERLEAAQADQKNLFLIIFQARSLSYYIIPLFCLNMFTYYYFISTLLGLILLTDKF
jgi:hypothetical protein